jgi:protein arginine kinase activator
MLCDLCHKNSATVHLTEIVNEKVMELHICAECAQNKTDELKQHISVSDFLSSLITEPGAEKKNSALACPMCGFTFYDFKKKGRLGCGHCYVTFRQYLHSFLKKIHGSSQHKGKLPSKVKQSVVIERNLVSLKARLVRAIELEEYEEAARLRDEIKKTEEHLKVNQEKT